MKLTGGPAFPVPDTRVGMPTQTQMVGMWLRDYFAAHAMVGIMANLGAASKTVIGTGYRTAKEEAELAYVVADAMMEARKNRE